MWTFIMSINEELRLLLMIVLLIAFIVIAARIIDSKKKEPIDGSIFISCDENGNRTCYLSISLPLDELLERDHITVKVDSDK